MKDVGIIIKVNFCKISIMVLSPILLRIFAQTLQTLYLSLASDGAGEKQHERD